jgi:hypothetical protein
MKSQIASPVHFVRVGVANCIYKRNIYCRLITQIQNFYCHKRIQNNLLSGVNEHFTLYNVIKVHLNPYMGDKMTSDVMIVAKNAFLA